MDALLTGSRLGSRAGPVQLINNHHGPAVPSLVWGLGLCSSQSLSGEDGLCNSVGCESSPSLEIGRTSALWLWVEPGTLPLNLLPSDAVGPDVATEVGLALQLAGSAVMCVCVYPDGHLLVHLKGWCGFGAVPS